MRLSFKVVQKVRLKLGLDIEGGVTSSIFPEIELWLNEDTDHYNAVRFFGRRRKMDKYRSLVDFLVSETFDEIKHLCMKFYAGKGCLLIDDPIMTVEKRRTMALRLMIALKHCYTIFCEQRKKSWKGHRGREASWSKFRHWAITAKVA